MKIMRAALALVVLALVLGPLTAPTSAQTSACPGISENGLWRTILGPRYPTGDQAMVSYAIDPVAPNIVYTTNGIHVMRTIDGGCTWEERFAVPELPTLDVPTSNVLARIVDITIPESRFGHSNVFLAVEEQVGPVVRPHVVVSRDGGSTFVASDTGLPPATGDVFGIHVAPDSPAFIYLHTQQPTGGDEIHASIDGGVTWERRTPLAEGVAANAMAVDPQDSNDLWFWGGAIYHSTDGGRTRATNNYVAQGIPVADVFHGPGAPSRVIAWEAETSTINVSEDGGRTWRRYNGPKFGRPLSMAHGNTVDDVILSMHEGVFRMVPGYRWLEITPDSGSKDIVDLQMSRTSVPLVYGRTTNTLEVFLGMDMEVELGPLDPANIADIDGKTVLAPKQLRLKLRHNQTRRVRYELELPPLPNPLDVFFLVDTSKSMDSSIAGLRTGMQDIINDLSAEGLDVQFGVGEIKDYPIPGYGDAQQGDFPYRLDQKITVPGPELVAALERLQASGGGALDQPESQLTGLFHAVENEGQPGFVPPDSDAEFRPDSLKVIVNITDAQFHDEAAHPSPPFERVVHALRENGVLQVGLAVYGPNGAKGLPDLQDMAEQTQTTAPEPVDCDDNGTTDIASGNPLVCEISDADYDGNLNLAPAIVATLKAVTEEVKVALVPDGPSAPELVPTVTPETMSRVNLKESNHLTFDVTFDCPIDLLGKTRDLTLQATVGEDIVAESTATVTCKPLLKKDKKDAVLPLLVVPAANLPAAIAAPPAPPPPIVEQIPASQSAAQAQGAMATEHQEEVQVAVAKQRSTFQTAKEETYEFSAYRDDKPAVPVALYLSAGAMALAYAFVATARNRARSLAFSRRRR
ncbi:MAG: hypothetical protein ACRDKT_07995 [Actinomycetota bacterium]